MKFRLVHYETSSENKFDADQRFEFFGNKNDIFNLWWLFTYTLHFKHVEVFNLAGDKCNPREGIAGMIDYNI